MPLFRNLKRTLLAAITVAASFTMALPVTAGGLFEAPDAVGNPSGADYTGYYPIAYFVGIRRTATQRTRITCLNVGGVNADAIAVQWYSTGLLPSSPPSANQAGGTLPFADLDIYNSQSASGTVPDYGIARVIARDSFRKLNVAASCRAHIEDVATGRTVATLEPWSPPARKKRRR